MTVRELVQNLNFRVFCGEANMEKEISGGYTSDLLSDVMGHAEAGNVWITLQTHKNVAAIASLKDLAAIILVKDFMPDDDMLAKAQEDDIPVLGTGEQTFDVSGKVFNSLRVI
ncbi:MAG: serine kinase [Bacteroidales bacterium]|jgi:predicted transcriptional regulator|nr:serine kinase [Bacteroidales bacterium]